MTDPQHQRRATSSFWNEDWFGAAAGVPPAVAQHPPAGYMDLGASFRRSQGGQGQSDGGWNSLNPWLPASVQGAAAQVQAQTLAQTSSQLRDSDRSRSQLRENVNQIQSLPPVPTLPQGGWNSWLPAQYKELKLKI